MKKKWLKRIIWLLAVVFILLNAIAIFHSYRFTHFSDKKKIKTESPDKLTTTDKLKTLFLGIENPRPENKIFPTTSYETIQLQSNKLIECWYLKAHEAKGSVILFHGYSGEKSSMLDKAAIFLELGYNTLLVDFMGSGGSEGNQTTIGYFEAEQVKTCYSYLQEKEAAPIYLFGTSMGAVAIMKALHDFDLKPSGVILECPFGSMYKTVCARFNSMHVPTFPMAALLVFWGGIQNNFWAFGHQPTNYATKINCPTLLLYGAKDQRVSKAEMDDIFNNLGNKKEFKIYPDAGHENYLIKYKKEWTNDIQSFLEITSK